MALVGYECDGAELSSTPGPLGYAIPSYLDGTPDSFLVLGVGRLDGTWQDRPRQETRRPPRLASDTRGGTVFTAATTDWSRVLASGDPATVQITRNVLDKLSARSLRIRGISAGCLATSIAVEGGSLTLTVDTSGLPHPYNLTYAWTSTAQHGPMSLPSSHMSRCPRHLCPSSVTVTV